MAAQDSFKVFSIAGRTDAAGATVADTDQEEMRLAVHALLGPGILPNMLDQTANPNAFRVRQDTGSNMQIKVGNGSTAKIDGLVLRGTVAGQGTYVARGETTAKTITVPAADATNPSRYGVFAFINDTSYAGTASRAYFDVSCIRGTPAGSPVTPGPLAAWSAYVLLWEFQLPALATAVTNTILDSGTAFDRRVAAVSPISPAVSPRPFATAALRDAQITAPVEGQLASITGEDRVYAYSGTAWQRVASWSAAGRTGCNVRRSVAQSIPNSTLTLIVFETEDSDVDGFAPGGSFNAVTVPTGLGGLYQASVEVAWAGAPGDTGATLIVNGTDNAISAPSGVAAFDALPNALFSQQLELVPTNTVGVKLLQSSGASLNASIVILRLWRVMV